MISETMPLCNKVGMLEVPAEAAREFWLRSNYFLLQPRMILPEFETFYRFEGPNDIRTYCTKQIKKFDSDHTEVSTYFVDLQDDEQYIGYGEVRFAGTSDKEYFADKPFVGYSVTEDSFQHHGLATRRLRIMNNFTKNQFGHPLNSDTMMTDAAIGVWRKLVSKGIAEAYKELDTTTEGGLDRFRFIS